MDIAEVAKAFVIQSREAMAGYSPGRKSGEMKQTDT